VWVVFAELAHRFDQPRLADGILERIATRFPGDPRVSLLRAAQLREKGDTDAAGDILAGVREAAMLVPELRFAIAAEYDALGDPLAAERVLAAGQQDSRIQALRASLLAKGEDKDGLRRLYYELKVDARAPNPAQRLLLGQVAEYLEHFDEALDWYQGVPGGE